MSDTSLVLRYPSNHIKLSKRDPSHQSNLQLSNSFSKISEKKTNVQIAQTQNFNIKENFNKISFSKALETNQPQTEDVQKLINLSENLNMENNNLKKKMENMKEKLSHPKLFKNTDQILDFKGFIKSNFQRFDELLNEAYSNKNILEIEQTKLRLLEKNIENNKKNEILKSLEGKTKKNQNLQYKKEKIEKQIINFEEELTNLKEKNNYYKEKINKKDFFTEYDKICKKVDELRKTNYILTESLKKYIPVQEN